MSKDKGMKRRDFIRAVGAGGAIATLPAIIDARPARAAKMTKMVFGEAPFISKGPNMIALQKGYYKKMGLDVKFKFFFDGALMVAPFSLSCGTPFFRARPTYMAQKAFDRE